jgi:hypothetical protein
MAEIISAADLSVGDLYRPVRGELFPVVMDQAFAVTEIRQVTYVETYTVIEAVNCTTGNRASINLRNEVKVAKLERETLANLQDALLYIANGESIHIVRYDDAFWA